MKISRPILSLLLAASAPLAFGAGNDLKFSQKNPADSAWLDRIFQPAVGGPITTPTGLLAALGGQMTYPTIAALKGVSVAGLATGTIATVAGYTAANDGGQGQFYYNASSALTDNTGTILAPNAGSGRWLRIYSGPLNVRWFGAKGTGATDDWVAVQTTFDNSHGAVYFPPGIYAVATEVSYNTDSLGPVAISGSGTLRATGTTNKALHIVGTAGVSNAPVSIQGLHIESATSGTSVAGLHLDGIAHWFVSDVWINGKSKMTSGIRLTASQQGEISGGEIINCVYGGYLEDNNGAGTVLSNGIDWHGMTFVNSAVNLLFAINSGNGASDDIFFHGNHMTNAAMQIDARGTGVGLLTFTDNHLEPVTPGYNGMISGGHCLISGNTFYGQPGSTDIELISSSAGTKVIGNLFDANVKVDTGATDTMFAFNSTGGTASDSGTRTRNFNNKAFAGTPFVGSSLFDATSITSSGTSAGDILTLNGNSTVSGAWGATLHGVGAGQDIYLRLQDVTLNGNTNGGSLTLKSAVGGSAWQQWTSAGTAMTGTVTDSGTFIIGTSSAQQLRLGESLQISTSANYGGAVYETWSSTAAQASVLDFFRSKSNSIGTLAAVAQNDGLGYINWRAATTAGVVNDAAGIQVFVDGVTIGSGMVPSRMIFLTAPASGSPTAALTLNSSQNAIFAGSATTTLGAYSLPQTAPGNPAASGAWVIYVDSGDGNKLKAKASTGTVVTLGTP